MNTKKISRLGDHPDRDDINLTNQNYNKNVDSESTPKSPLINLPLDTIKFLKILDPNAEHFHFQVFGDSGNNNVSPATIVGSLEEKVESLAAKNKAGAGIFVAIQPHPKDKPRKTEFTTRIRTFLIDLDGAPLEPVLDTLKKAKLNPNMVVNTSFGKYHIYLKVSDCPLSKYSAVQKELAAMFHGDPKVHDLPRVARLVGFWHKKDPGNPFKVKFHSVGTPEPYTFGQIVRGLGLDLNQVKGNGADGKDGKQTNNGSKNGATPHPSNEIHEGERNNTIFAIGRRLRALDISEQEIRAEIVKANEERCIPPLDGDEINTIFQSIVKNPPDPSPFGVITPEGEGDIARVMQNSGMGDLTTDSTEDVIIKAVHASVELSKEMNSLSRTGLRNAVQKKLKDIRVPSPAALVKQAFPIIKPDEREDAKVISSLQETDPHDEEVDGATLLDEMEAIFRKHVLVEKQAISAIALWIMHAWCIEAFSLSPFLRINSPTKGCGKTTLLMLISELLPKCLLTANITTASMFRLIDKFGASVGIDEADGAFKENPELLSLVNASYTRSTAQVPRCASETNEVELFSVWGPKVICGIGKLPPTTEDRSIVIPLKKKKSTDKMERFRFDKLGAFGELKSRLKRFADDSIDALKEAEDPDLPEELGDRPADNWRQLIMIADLVGENWPNKARASAKVLNDSQEDEEQLVHLLRDIRVVSEGKKAMPSAKLTELLIKIEGSPWANLSSKYKDELTANKLARMLAPLRIKPKKNRFEEGSLQGYKFIDFDDAFDRYLSKDEGKNGEEFEFDEILS